MTLIERRQRNQRELNLPGELRQAAAHERAKRIRRKRFHARFEMLERDLEIVRGFDRRLADDRVLRHVFHLRAQIAERRR